MTSVLPGCFIAMFAVAAIVLGAVAIIVIKLSRGRLKGYGLAIAGIASGIVMCVILGVTVDEREAVRYRPDPWISSYPITEAHLFLVTVARDVDRAGRVRGGNVPPAANEAMSYLQDQDTIGDAVRKATGRSARGEAVLEILQTMRAQFFTTAAKVTAGGRTVEIPAYTVAFFVVDRSPHQGLGAATPLGWAIIDEASRDWRHKSLLQIVGTQVVSATTVEEFRFER